MKAPDAILAKLTDLIQQGRFAELETEAVEIKPVPATGADWKEVHKSANAFLNTRGGILILGIRKELREIFGTGFDALDDTAKDVLGVLFRHSRYAHDKAVSAKQACFSLWYDRGGAAGDIKQFDTFYRKIRYLFNKLEKGGYLRKVDGTRGYVLCEERQGSHLI